MQNIKTTTISNEIIRFHQFSHRKYYLKIGKKSFSPVIQSSSSLVLKYISQSRENQTEKISPFFLCFPEKKLASIWLSISLLTNFFHEDYIESEGIAVSKLEKNKKYSLYDSIGKYVCEVKKSNEKKIKFTFKDGTIECHESIKYNIKNVDQSRKLNKLSHYKNKKGKLNLNRSSLSKILEPKGTNKINDQVIISKILLIAGRGNVKKINELLETQRIFDDSLNTIYSPNENIILKADLKDFKSLFEKNKEEKISSFLKWIENLIRVSKVDKELSVKLKEIRNSIYKERIISNIIDNKFTKIVEEYAEIEPKLQILHDNHYPGISTELPDNLRAVIINDLDQIEYYSNTINGFLQLKIPVIFISNRLIQKSSDFLSYKKLFNSQNGIWKEAYRINWNRSKIESLIKVASPNKKYLDSDLWNVCIRYASQVVHINTYTEPSGLNLDKKLRYITKKINDLEGFEDLKKSYFNYLFPILYFFKNSIEVDEKINQFVIFFYKIWEKNNKYLNDKELVNEIEDLLLQLIHMEFKNSKFFDKQDMFCNTITFPENVRINIPLSYSKNLPNSLTQKINFSGFPFRELSDKYLHDALLNFFIPEITIHCWPYEGEVTLNYILKRIKSGYFFDKIPYNTKFPKELLINNQTKIDNEICTIIHLNNDTPNLVKSIDFETELIHFDNFRFDKYQVFPENFNESKYIVECNIIKFNDGSFMFLPSQSSVLSEFELDSGDILIKNLKFNHLFIGLRVFKYDTDQFNYSKIIETNHEVKEAYKVLEIWRRTLDTLYKKFYSLDRLEQHFNFIIKKNKIIGSNPEVVNLRRWLNDEDMISPSEANIRLILLAGKENGVIHQNTEQLIIQTIKAYKFIKSTHIRVGHHIKSAITTQLKHNCNEASQFSINVENLKVNIIAKTIIELQKSNMNVEYHETRKFLC